MTRTSRLDLSVACLTGLTSLALYIRTLAPGVLEGDSGEFQFAAWLAGLPHPTGYPLYLILGYLWTHLLPWGTPAWRLNLLSALFGALAVALVYLLSLAMFRQANPEPQSLTSGRSTDYTSAPRRIRFPASVAGQVFVLSLVDGRAAPQPYRLLALVAAATFAVTPTFWSQVLAAEVYGLQAVLLAAFLLALVTWANPPERSGRLYAAALIFGLGLAHHRTIILFLPAALLYIVAINARRVVPPHWWLHRWPAIPLALAPLLLYLYVPLRAPHTPYLTLSLGLGQTLQLYQPSLAGFFAYITGETFASAFRSGAASLAQVPRAGAYLVRELTLPGVVFAMLGVLWLVRRPGRPLLVLTGAGFLAVLAFNLFYGIGDIYVYYIPAYLLASVWIAFGTSTVVWIIGQLIGRFRGTPTPGRPHPAAAPGLLVLATLLALLLPTWLLLSRYATADQSHNDQARQAWTARLAGSQPPPERAVLVSNDRDEMMPLWYLQYVEGTRLDLTGLFPLILPGAAWSDVGSVVERALKTGRPVYLIKPMPGLDAKFDLQPSGNLVQVLGLVAKTRPARQAGLDFGGLVRLAGYDVQPDRAQVSDTFTVTLYWQALQPLPANYTSFVHLLDSQGNKLTQDDHRPGGDYYPTSLWRPGEVLRDTHVLTLPAGNRRPGPYTVLAGLYTRGRGITNLGEPQAITIIQ